MGQSFFGRIEYQSEEMEKVQEEIVKHAREVWGIVGWNGEKVVRSVVGEDGSIEMIASRQRFDEQVKETEEHIKAIWSGYEKLRDLGALKIE